jgi:hypothetical protein
MYMGELKNLKPFWLIRTPEDTLSQYRLVSSKHAWLLISIGVRAEMWA